MTSRSNTDVVDLDDGFMLEPCSSSWRMRGPGKFPVQIFHMSRPNAILEATKRKEEWRRWGNFPEATG